MGSLASFPSWQRLYNDILAGRERGVGGERGITFISMEIELFKLVLALG